MRGKFEVGVASTEGRRVMAEKRWVSENETIVADDVNKAEYSLKGAILGIWFALYTFLSKIAKD